MAEDLAAILRTAGPDPDALAGRVGRLLDQLDALLASEGLAGV
jgi:hypothetical protein